MNGRGVCLIAYGRKAEQEAHECLKSVLRFNSWPHCFAGDQIEQAPDYTDVQKSRWAKVTLDRWSPFDRTLYLDADTRVQGNISAGFDMLDDGFEVLIAASAQQGNQNMWHISREEREKTFDQYQCDEVLQLQGGVFWFRQCEAVRRFFEAWRVAWLEYRQFDQAALLRALHMAPVRLHVLGWPFNGGALIAHRYGSIVR